MIDPDVIGRLRALEGIARSAAWLCAALGDARRHRDREAIIIDARMVLGGELRAAGFLSEYLDAEGRLRLPEPAALADDDSPAARKGATDGEEDELD